MFLQPPVRHVAAVARQHLGLGQIGDRPVFVGIAEDELAGLQRCTGTRCRLLARSLHHRLRQPVAEAEVVVGVVERRRRVEVEVRQAAHAVGAGEQLVVLLDGPSHCSSVRENRIAIACRSSPARPPTQCSGALAPVSPRMSARGAMPSRNSSGKVCQRLLGYAERAQTIPGERQRDPASDSSMVAVASAADCTLSSSSDSQARPPAGVSNVRNS